VRNHPYLGIGLGLGQDERNAGGVGGGGSPAPILRPRALRLEQRLAQYASHSDSALLDVGGCDWTWTGMAQLFTNNLGEYPLLGKYPNGYLLDYNGGALAAYYGSSSNERIAATDPGAWTLNTWYFFRLQYELATTTLSLRVNEGVASTRVLPDLSGNAFPFAIGSYGGVVGAYWDGLVDSVSFWKRLLTSDEAATLRQGQAYAVFPDALKVSLVAHYELDDDLTDPVSGLDLTAHGLSPLTYVAGRV
jgi:concanavalin A-like lectin/glucanase superfamily protein